MAPFKLFNYITIVLGLVFWLCASAVASDLEREQRLIDEVEANLFSGELIMLNAQGTDFVAVEMASETDSTRGAVILLHGRGFRADWPENIGPLRVGLSEVGWHTLSLQMPVLEKAAKYFDYLPHTWRGYSANKRGTGLSFQSGDLPSGSTGAQLQRTHGHSVDGRAGR